MKKIQRHLMIIYKQLMMSIKTRNRRLYSNKEKKVLIVFNDMIVDMKASKKLNSIVAGLFM